MTKSFFISYRFSEVIAISICLRTSGCSVCHTVILVACLLFSAVSGITAAVSDWLRLAPRDWCTHLVSHFWPRQLGLHFLACSKLPYWVLAPFRRVHFRLSDRVVCLSMDDQPGAKGTVTVFLLLLFLRWYRGRLLGHILAISSVFNPLCNRSSALCCSRNKLFNALSNSFANKHSKRCCRV